MNAERRSKYVDYIADAIRFAAKETGPQWPVRPLGSKKD